PPLPPPGTTPSLPPPGALPPAATPTPGRPGAGGLTAPGAGTDRAPSELEARLDRAREEDSGRGLKWFYVDVEGGYQYLDFDAFGADDSELTADLLDTGASGGFVGVGAGLTLARILTFGPRFRAGFFENGSIFTVGGEVGLRIPIGLVEPHVSLGGGYAAVGGLGGPLEGVIEAADIQGGYGRVGGGLDFWLGRYVTAGFGASWAVLGLQRGPVGSDRIASLDGLTPGRRRILETDGTGIGSSVSVVGRIGLQF
ncbi:MAG: hypothetical protein AAGN82_27965, partial [Myxococcota bacterium]